MNFKMNGWTLLFAIAAMAAAYLYTCECDPVEISTDVALATPCKSCDPPPDDYKIPAGQADRWIKSYVKYASTLTDTTIVKNPNVRYFHLPRCEMVEMINEVGEESDVIAHLAIDDSDRLIKLVFEDTPVKGSAAQVGGGGFYDFTAPCPTVCED